MEASKFTEAQSASFYGRQRKGRQSPRSAAREGQRRDVYNWSSVKYSEAVD
jgi:hypothetical protein